jgi:hypothetical protein
MSKKVAGWETKYNAKKKAVVINNSEDCNVTFWSVGVEKCHPKCGMGNDAKTYEGRNVEIALREKSDNLGISSDCARCFPSSGSK